MRESSGGVWAMALHVIVDGHNLQAQTSRISGGVRLYSEMACEGLLRDLAAYCQRKAHAMAVVFDGW